MNNPLFPALRSGHRLFQRPPRKSKFLAACKRRNRFFGHSIFVVVLLIIISSEGRSRTLPAALAVLERIERAIDEEPATVSVGEIIQSLRATGSIADDEQSMPTSWMPVFEHGCQRAGPKDIPAFVSMFEAIPAKLYDKSRAFPPLAEAWLRVRRLAERPIENFWHVPREQADAPPEIEKLPATLQHAWRTYRAAVPPKLAPKQAHNFLEEEKRFWEVIADLLAGRGGPWAETLEGFYWGHTCGTGSEIFSQPLSQALLLAYVAENRLPEALAAALTVDPGGSMFRFDQETMRETPLKIIRESGIDWQAALIGRLVASDLVEGSPESYGRSQAANNLQPLVSEADDSGVSMLLEVARLVPRDEQHDFSLYLDALRALAPPLAHKEPGLIIFSSSGSLRQRDAPLGRDVELAILSHLNDLADEKSSVSAAQSLLACFEAWWRPETRPALRRLVEHPSETVAMRAAKLLEEMGEKVVVPPKAPPVRYRIVINGTAASGLKVEWCVHRPGGGSRSSTEEADAEGVITISRDDFLDGVDRVELGSSSVSKPEEMWFRATLPPPAVEGKIHDVGITTGPCSLLLSIPQKVDVGKDSKMEIEMQLRDEANPKDSDYSSRFRFVLPVSGRVDFPHLMAGRYAVEVRVPGCVTWSQDADVSPNGTVSVPLERSRSVRFTLHLPEGWSPSTRLTRLLRDGRDVSDTFRTFDGDLTYRGLPAGQYELRLLAGRCENGWISLEDGERRTTWQRGSGPDRAERYAAASVRFGVTTDAPDEIDLGDIRPGEKRDHSPPRGQGER
jgi:hypothetical protein